MADVTDDVHAAMFGEFTEEEIRKYYQLSIKAMHGIDHLESYFQNQMFPGQRRSRREGRTLIRVMYKKKEE